MKRTKRTQRIRLLLLGGLAAGALSGCSPQDRPAISADNVYTNNYYVPGAGYYHAPFCTWYPIPYNHFDAQKQMYYWGGNWCAIPHQSITNLSSPSPQTALAVQARSSDIPRGGFGCMATRGGYYHVYS